MAQVGVGARTNVRLGEHGATVERVDRKAERVGAGFSDGHEGRPEAQQAGGRPVVDDRGAVAVDQQFAVHRHLRFELQGGVDLAQAVGAVVGGGQGLGGAGRVEHGVPPC